MWSLAVDFTCSWSLWRYSLCVAFEMACFIYLLIIFFSILLEKKYIFFNCMEQFSFFFLWFRLHVTVVCLWCRTFLLSASFIGWMLWLSVLMCVYNLCANALQQVYSGYSAWSSIYSVCWPLHVLSLKWCVTSCRGGALFSCLSACSYLSLSLSHTQVRLCK